MTFHACAADGTKLGELSESEFQQKISAGELRPEHFYWHEGMADWKPISEYRLLAKTQRISFHPPTRKTVKINMDAQVKSSKAGSRKNSLSRLLDRIRGKK